MAFRFSEIVGRYRLVVTTELLAFIERSFVEPAPESERRTVRQAAHDEARLARLEIADDGSVVSSAGPQVLYRSQLVAGAYPCDELVLYKPGGERVALRLLDPDTLEATQPGRPVITFARLVATDDDA